MRYLGGGNGLDIWHIRIFLKSGHLLLICTYSLTQALTYFLWLRSDEPFDPMSSLVPCGFKLHNSTASSVSYSPVISSPFSLLSNCIYFDTGESLVFITILVSRWISGCMITLFKHLSRLGGMDLTFWLSSLKTNQNSAMCAYLHLHPRDVKWCLCVYAPKQFVLIKNTRWRREVFLQQNQSVLEWDCSGNSL